MDQMIQVELSSLRKSESEVGHMDDTDIAAVVQVAVDGGDDSLGMVLDRVAVLVGDGRS
jgi:hypothetical protein|tara:strand:- start:13769 stop:13945 length:177 start_codon:yes stop_codon:yes gene_type:complete